MKILIISIIAIALIAGEVHALTNAHVELVDKSVREGDTVHAVFYVEKPGQNTTLFYTIKSSDGTIHPKKGFVIDGERELLTYDVPYPSEKGTYSLEVEVYSLNAVTRYSESFTVTDNAGMDYGLAVLGVLSVSAIVLLARKKKR